MSFETVFDVTRVGFRAWWAFLPFAGAGAIGLVLWVSGTGALRRAGQVLCATGLVFAIGAEYAAYADYRGLKSALEERRFVPVEGIVADFVPGGADGHPPERFCVSNHCYSYSPASIGAEFNKVSRRGGPVRARQQVRIADVGGRIARLEIERGAGTSAP
jgi:hypothetical protein